MVPNHVRDTAGIIDFTLVDRQLHGDDVGVQPYGAFDHRLLAIT